MDAGYAVLIYFVMITTKSPVSTFCPVSDHDNHETLPALENGGNPFNMLSGMGGNMSQQLAGLMGMQGMGMPSMVSSHLFAVKQT